jgi:hypothetical protein
MGIRLFHGMDDPVEGRAAPSRRDAERALRDVGLSARQAKRVISGGWAAAFKEDAGDAAELLEALQQFTDRLRGKS